MNKKIFWCLQQLEFVGGTETVSIQLANMLVEQYDYDITFIISFDSDLSKTPYTISPKIKIIQLGINKDLARFDDNYKKYFKQGHLIKSTKLLNSALGVFAFNTTKYKKKISSLISEDDILICSSIDNYFLAPKHKKTLFHFHFNSKGYFDLFTQIGLKKSITPYKYVFLCKETMDVVISKKPKLKDKVTYINNPCRFNLEQSFDYHNNTITFIGRYSEQKNPILALKVAKVLHEHYKDLDFKLNFYGEGILEDKMLEFVKHNKLQDCVSINSPNKDVENILRNSDLLLMTSKFEGLPLIKLEAGSKSLPTISSNWGEPIHDIIENGKNGYIIDSNKPVDIAKQIYEILSSKENILKLKQSTFEYEHKFNSKIIVEQWDNLFKKM